MSEKFVTLEVDLFGYIYISSVWPIYIPSTVPSAADTRSYKLISTCMVTAECENKLSNHMKHYQSISRLETPSRLTRDPYMLIEHILTYLRKIAP